LGRFSSEKKPCSSHFNFRRAVQPSLTFVKHGGFHALVQQKYHRFD